MILEVTRKIRSSLTGNGTLVSLTSGMYLNEAPPRQVYPYITYFNVGDAPIHSHTGIVDNGLWQFSVWSTNLMALGSITQEVKNTFDGKTLALNTLTEVGLLRAAGGAVIIDSQDETHTVYHQPIEYQFFST